MHTGWWGMWSFVTEMERGKGPGQANRNNAADKLPFHSNNRGAWVVVSGWEQTEHCPDEQECILCNAAYIIGLCTEHNDFDPEGAGSMFPQNVGIPPPKKVMSVNFSCALFSLLDLKMGPIGCAETSVTAQYLRRVAILPDDLAVQALVLTLRDPIQGSPRLALSSSALNTWI